MAAGNQDATPPWLRSLPIPRDVASGGGVGSASGSYGREPYDIGTLHPWRCRVRLAGDPCRRFREKPAVRPLKAPPQPGACPGGRRPATGTPRPHSRRQSFQAAGRCGPRARGRPCGPPYGSSPPNPPREAASGIGGGSLPGRAAGPPRPGTPFYPPRQGTVQRMPGRDCPSPPLPYHPFQGIRRAFRDA